MPQIINKRKSRFVILDRELMADKRLKSNHKILYSLLCSLSESCDNVFPSYKWLADQIGYETEGKTERALGMFMARNIEPLIELGMIKSVERVGYQNDYEIFDYTPAQKCAGTPHKNVRTPPHIFVQPLLIEKEEEEKEEESNTNPPKIETPKPNETQEISDWQIPDSDLDEVLQGIARMFCFTGLYNQPTYFFDKFELRTEFNQAKAYYKQKDTQTRNKSDPTTKLISWFKTNKSISEPKLNYSLLNQEPELDDETYDLREIQKLNQDLSSYA